MVPLYLKHGFNKVSLWAGLTQSVLLFPIPNPGQFLNLRKIVLHFETALLMTELLLTCREFDSIILKVASQSREVLVVMFL